MVIKRIDLHVGHFGDRTGASGYLDEVQQARKFMWRIFEILQANKVPSTFYEDKVSKNKTDNVNHLIAYHNKMKNGLIVSGHLNASSGSIASPIGTEVLYYSEKLLATNLSNVLASSSGLKNRGAKQRSDIGVLVRTNDPAVLIEFGFVNSKADCDIMVNKFEDICQAVAKELALVLGITIGSKPIAQQPIQQQPKEEEELLNDTGRAECKAMIKKGVEKGIFHDKHVNLEVYADKELLSYALAYLNRVNK